MEAAQTDVYIKGSLVDSRLLRCLSLFIRALNGKVRLSRKRWVDATETCSFVGTPASRLNDSIAVLKTRLITGSIKTRSSTGL